MSSGLTATNLTKDYGRVRVVHGVSIDLRPGQIRAVVGENGAGKSTLMKMLAGIIRPTSGQIELDGRQVSFGAPQDAGSAGIGIVHQELQIVPDLTIADNLMLVRPPKASGLRRRSSGETRFVADLLERVGLARSPRVFGRDLSAAESQLLEVAKALATDAKYIIFDEPTSALPPHEVEGLLQLVEGLRASGLGILYISHHLSEVMRLADAVTVLRDGRVVGELLRANMQLGQIIHLMVDRPVALYANDLAPPRAEVAFEARAAATTQVSGLNFTIRAGEIMGFAGLIGSGMHEAAHALVGAKPLIEGELFVSGKSRRFDSPHMAARAGVVLVPEERKLQGIFPGLSVEANMHAGRYQLFSKMGVVSRSRMRLRTAELVGDFDIRLVSPRQPIATLSGGNQQKAVVARCVQSDPVLLVVAEPTRGVDIGAKDEIHKRIISLAASGRAIVVVSSELDEVLALAHRIAVFADGKMTGLLEKHEATPQRIMTLATPPERKKRDAVV